MPPPLDPLCLTASSREWGGDQRGRQQWQRCCRFSLLLLLLLLSLKFKAYKVIKLYATSFVSETKKEIDTARDRDRGWIEGGNSGSFSRKCWAFLDRLLLCAVVAAAYC